MLSPAEANTSRTELSFQLFVRQIPILPERVQISFYRIAQEALNNTVKHSQANQVTVSLNGGPPAPAPTQECDYEVRMEIADDGVGFSPGSETPEHMGLVIMRERAANINAHLIIESQPGYGTQITLIWCGNVEEMQ